MMRDPRIETWIEAFYHKRISGGIEFLLGLSANTLSVGAGTRDCAGMIGAASPEEYPPPLFHLTVMLTKLILKSLSFTPVRVMEQWLRIFHKFDKLHPSQPHWYILILGVHPEHQGKGLGGQLLKQVLQRADDEKAPVYLESSNPKNLDFYRRYGFEVTDEIVPISGCPPIWGLFREPETSEKKAS
jgi:ribosomal protein S18 acetylase RimI-like enzyme